MKLNTELLLDAPNPKELKQLYKDIFTRHEYYVEFKTDTPRILDVGAHLGLASLYFAQLAPKAQITCFEANPQLYPYLEANLKTNLPEETDYTLVKKAVADKNGQIEFYLDQSTDSTWTSNGSLMSKGWTNNLSLQPIEVESVRLSEYLDQPIDLIKLDIEASEGLVVNEIADQLNFVDQFIIEIHRSPTNDPGDWLSLLRENRFELSLYQGKNQVPFDLLRQRKTKLYLLHAQKQT